VKRLISFISTKDKTPDGVHHKLQKALKEYERNKIAASSQRTILLIEDEDSLRKLYADILRSKDYKVIDISDVSDNKLENALESGRIDAIISGIMQPYKDGLQVLKELKADDRYKAIPYIISSSLSNERIIKESFNSGAELYLIHSQETPDSWVIKVDDFLKKSFGRNSK